MKKFIAMLLSVIIMTAASGGLYAAGTETDVSVYLEGGKVLFTDAQPIHTGTRVLVPVRGFFERIGVTVDWNSINRIAIIKDDNREIMLEADNRAVLNNGQVEYLDCSAVIRNNRTFIPLRYISESFGYNVRWDGNTGSVHITKNPDVISEGASVLPVISDLDSFYQLLKYNGYMADYLYYGNIDILPWDMTDSPQIAPSMSVDEAAGAAEPEASNKSDDYSGTNNQVEGIEEGDLVKTDGKYLYIVRSDEVKIVNADPNDLSVISSIPCRGGINEIFIYRNRLVLINGNSRFTGNVRNDREKNLLDLLFGRSDIIGTNVRVYDITDRANPVLDIDRDYEGRYLSSRMIDNHLYIVTNAVVRFFSEYFNDEITDIIGTNNKAGFIEEMKKDPEEERIILQQTGIQNSGELFDILKDAIETYVTPKYRDNKTGVSREISLKDISYFKDMVRPAYMITAGLDLDSGSEDIRAYLGSTGTMYVSGDHMYTALAAYEYNALKSKLNRFPSYDYLTTIHKFGLKDGKILYKSKGRVPGNILNQFSMDEYNGFFRIATTTGSGGVSENNVYTLDEKMEIAGRLEGIAQGEKIYSTRFAGERIYMVTFRQLDPFFVIDAADPTRLSVLGYLKIPGFSTYMHILDKDHVLGFGYDTQEADWWSTTTGFKLSLFDVSDVSRPIEIKKEVIGKNSESSLANDHKALMISLDKGIMGFPVNYLNSDTDYFAGYFLYNISNKDFSYRGRVTHVPDNALMYEIRAEDFIDRGLYIGDCLYTISDGQLRVHDLGTLKEIGRLGLR